MSKDKYGDIDQLVGVASPGAEEAAQRRKRPSPALAAMTGQKPLRVVDELREDIKRLEQQLEENKATTGGDPIVLKMPVTKQDVTFKLQRIDPELIDVSPENERIQDFLDEISLQDILPSIRKHGQQKPGTVRPKANGRFELIEGSRRLAAVKLAGSQYLALVGDVSDADIRELSVIENKHQDVSAYEKAKAYQRQLEAGEYSNWSQLAAAKGISSTQISRYKACVELEELFVRILPSPSDMPVKYGETIAQLLKKDEFSLRDEAERLLKARQEALQKGAHLLEVDEILGRLKSSVRSKATMPTQKQPVIYKSRDGKVCLKHGMTNKGNTKLEVSGVDQEKIEKILKFLRDTLKVDPNT